MMLLIFTSLSAKQQGPVHLLQNVSNQNHTILTVGKLNGTEMGTKNISIFSQVDGIFEGSLPKPQKIPDSFLFKFSIGFIFAVTPVSTLYYECCDAEIIFPLFLFVHHRLSWFSVQKLYVQSLIEVLI